MKRWIHSSPTSAHIKASTESNPKKLKRTRESGHSYEGDITFENAEEMKKWLEEDELYED